MASSGRFGRFSNRRDRGFLLGVIFFMLMGSFMAFSLRNASTSSRNHVQTQGYATVRTSEFINLLGEGSFRSVNLDSKAGIVSGIANDEVTVSDMFAGEVTVNSVRTNAPETSELYNPTYLQTVAPDTEFSYQPIISEGLDKYMVTVIAIGIIEVVVLLIIVILLVRRRRMAAMSQGSGGPIDISNLRPGDRVTTNRPMSSNFSIERPDASFSDIIGIPEAIEEITEMETFLRNPEKFRRAGAVAPKGVLLQGPPGVGKTALARALAGESSVPFIATSGSNFIEMFAGVGAQRVRELFTLARANQPSIIFIDEIDAVGGRRGMSINSSDEREQTLNQLLVEMDGFSMTDSVIVLAATNRADRLDEALKRAGRFDRTIAIGAPNKEGRKEILKLYAQDRPFAHEIDFDMLAAHTYGLVGADLKNLMNEASIMAVRNSDETGLPPRITYADLQEASERVVAGPAMKSKRMMDEEKEQVAFHEAGHAIVSHMLPLCDPIQKITIVPRQEAMGYVQYYIEEDTYITTADKLSQTLAALVAGRVSERMFCGIETSGASNDLQRATTLARRMADDFAMNGEDGSLEVSVYDEHGMKLPSGEHDKRVSDRVGELLKEANDLAKKILGEHEEDVRKVVEILMDEEVIEGDQVSRILGQAA